MKVCSEHFRAISQTQYIWYSYIAKIFWMLEGLEYKWKLQSKQIIKSKLKVGTEVVNQLDAFMSGD